MEPSLNSIPQWLFQAIAAESGSSIFSFLFIAFGGAAFWVAWRFANIHLKGLERRVESGEENYKRKFENTIDELTKLNEQCENLENLVDALRAEIASEKLECHKRISEIERAHHAEVMEANRRADNLAGEVTTLKMKILSNKGNDNA